MIKEPVDLATGATSPVGLSILDGLTAMGGAPVATGRSARRPSSIPERSDWLTLDLLSPIPSQLPEMPRWRDLGLRTFYHLAHPTFHRHEPDPFSLLPALRGVHDLHQEIRPHLQKGSSLLFLLPDLDRLAVSGYLSARIYLGGLKGLIRQWKVELAPKGIFVGGLTMVHVPGHTTPNMNPDILEKLKRSSPMGRLFTETEVARFLMTLAHFSEMGTSWPSDLLISLDSQTLFFP
jgi:hypothetical protein